MKHTRQDQRKLKVILARAARDLFDAHPTLLEYMEQRGRIVPVKKPAKDTDRETRKGG